MFKNPLLEVKKIEICVGRKKREMYAVRPAEFITETSPRVGAKENIKSR